MNHVILTYDGHFDYLFTLDNIRDLELAIEYKNEKLETEEYPDCDFEYIIEYLENNNIEFEYIELFSVDTLEY